MEPRLLLSAATRAAALEVAVLNQLPEVYLRVDEIAGTLAGDSSGNSNDGSYSGGPILDIPGVWPAAGLTGADFDGDDDAIAVPDDGSLDFRREVSMSLWVKPESMSATWQPVVYKGNGSVESRTYALWLHETGYLHLSSADASGYERITTAAGVVQAGLWHHIVGVVDRNAGEMRIYVNGELLADGPVRTADSVSHSADLLIGAENEPTARNFDGIVDEVAVFGAALTAAEVKSIVDAADGLKVLSTGLPNEVSAATAPLTSFEVEFSDPVDFTGDASGGFWLDDISIEAPDATVVNASAITSLGANRYRIDIPAITQQGVHSVTIGPNVLDVDGEAMDQNRNATVGEGDDAWVQTFAVDTIAPSLSMTFPSPSQARVFDYVDITAFEPLGGDGITVGDVSISGPTGAVTVHSVESLAGNVYRLHVDQQTVDGAYTVTVDAAVADAFGNPLDTDADGDFGEPTEDDFVSAIALNVGPAIVDQSPLRAHDLTGDAFSSVTVTFNEPIDYASDGSGSFWLDDIAVDGPAGAVAVTGITQISPVQYAISFASQTALGAYSISVGPAVTDLAGNAMDQDADGVQGESADDLFTWQVVALEGPTVFWDGGGDGSHWHDPANWTDDTLPGPTDNVWIEVAWSPSVLFDGGAGTVAVKSLYAWEPVTFSGGSLTVAERMLSRSEVSLNAGSSVQTSELAMSDGGWVTLYVGGFLAATQVEILDGGTFWLDTATSAQTVHIASGGVLTHIGGQDGFELNVTGDMTVDAGGAVNADGKGYAQNSGPGAGAQATNGGGGGYGGEGGDGYGAGGGAYGSLILPDALGSGGGRGYYTSQMTASGGKGGGLVRINVAGTLTVDGEISANGVNGGTGKVYTAYWSGGGGAGGSIVCNVGTLAGSGVIAANGGNGGYTNRAGGGGGGRIALYYDNLAFSGGAIEAQGGAGKQNGGAGTVFMKSALQTYGELIVDNLGRDNQAVTPLLSSVVLDTLTLGNLGRLEIPAGVEIGVTAASLSLTGDGEAVLSGRIYRHGAGGGAFDLVDVDAGFELTIDEAGELISQQLNLSTNAWVWIKPNVTHALTVDHLEILPEGTFWLDNAASFNTVHIAADGVLTHANAVAAFDLSVASDMTIDAGGAVYVDGRGFAADSGPGAGQSYDAGQSTAHAGGAGHGGDGGSATTAGGSAYDSYTQPSELGSGGGTASWHSGGSAGRIYEYGGRGGGAVRIDVAGTLIVDGAISADGLNGEAGYAYWGDRWSGGGGAGGSIWVSTGTLSGAGAISADGGDAGYPGEGGGGAGGRIALYYNLFDYTGDVSVARGDGLNDGGFGSCYYSIPEVKGRHLFYNNSSFDGYDPGANHADDQAIATNRQPILPGETSGAGNVSGSAGGLNGIMVDIGGIADPDGLSAGTLSNYLTFRFGTGDPAGWEAAPAPVEVLIRQGAGVGASHRVTVTWPAGALQDGWLEVTTRGNAATGLASDDVFSFGSLVGDATGDGQVNLTDLAILASLWGEQTDDPAVANSDFSGDGSFDLTDLALLASNYGASLGQITLPVAPPAASTESFLAASTVEGLAESDVKYGVEAEDALFDAVLSESAAEGSMSAAPEVDVLADVRVKRL